jgi:quercetin dioxygenase-like cupin family protein
MLLGTRRATERSTGNKHRLLGRAYSTPQLRALCNYRRVVMAGRYPEKIKSLPLYDGRFDAYKLEAAESDVLFASYPAGTSIPAHTHDTDNHGVITRGELILTIGGVVSIVATGDWYHVPANLEHSARFEVETDEIEFWFKVNT